jgi:hypothetical protein
MIRGVRQFRHLDAELVGKPVCDQPSMAELFQRLQPFPAEENGFGAPREVMEPVRGPRRIKGTEDFAEIQVPVGHLIDAVEPWPGDRGLKMRYPAGVLRGAKRAMLMRPGPV